MSMITEATSREERKPKDWEVVRKRRWLVSARWGPQGGALVLPVHETKSTLRGKSGRSWVGPGAVGRGKVEQFLDYFRIGGR